MKRKFFQTTLTASITICLFFVSQTPAIAAPGNLVQSPLFVTAPTQPNIFFMLDDSGSMNWSMPSDGVSSTALITRGQYDTIPDDTREWNVWCLGANLMSYDPTIDYKPWAANKPGTTDPFPDQTDLQNVWADPATLGVGSIAFSGGENENINGGDTGSANLSAAPVVQWTDTDNDGRYDAGECPTSLNDARARRADSLSAAQQINFANWFAYYRTRELSTKAAVSRVVSNSSARMGMATLHHNNDVGFAIKDMTDSTNKKALLEEIVNINSSGGTPLRTRLNWVGQYFDQKAANATAPSGLNIENASSPILSAANGGECQQNFVMLMTDGQWNGGSADVGHQDQTVDNNLVHRAHRDNTPNTLADVAMKWYKTDLAPGLANKVPVQSGADTQNLDQYDQQHLVTFGVAFGPTGTINADPTDRTQAFSWPSPSANADTTVDDLRHAAYNGRGKFLSAKNPETLISSLQEVLSDIESRQGSAASVAFNSTSLSAGTTLFFASFNTTNWSGDLESFIIDPITGDLAPDSLWSAASVLDSRSNNDMLTNRVIYTWGINSAGKKDGVLLNWNVSDPQPAANILDDFKRNQDSTNDADPFLASQNRLGFVRGNTSDDGTGLIRNRSSRLGDIINSPPLFVGKPLSNWPDNDPFGAVGKRYSDFQTTLKTTPRKNMVYVGANDGMLHGFKADTGEEIFAYLPGATSSALDNSGLHFLTEIDYAHNYYVDGPIVKSDVYMRTAAGGIGSKDWHTIVVGSLRGGGQGVYALDVTNSNQFSNTQDAAKASVLWEFTDQDDADLGFTYSTPEIVMMNNNKWAVVFGNGYNATGTNTAKLMILFIEEGVDGQWDAADYVKIDTGVGTGGNKNGLSTPALIDLNHDGKIDRIYAGDLHGNMWAFDVTNINESQWEVAHKDGMGVKVPLFIAGNTKPITMQPLLAKPDNTWDPDMVDTVSNTPNIMVYFGTGQYIATGDAATTNQQTFYGIWDADGAGEVSSAKLVEQTFISDGVKDDSFRVLSENLLNYEANPNDGNRGLFVDLPEPGERVVVNAFELAGIIFFNTLTPSSTPCGAGGSSWRMGIDKKTGGNPEIVAFDVNSDGILNEADKTENDGHNSAGSRFEGGIASSTSVITTETGGTAGKTSYGYTSGTDIMRPKKDILPGGGSDDPGGTPVKGERRGWIELIK